MGYSAVDGFKTPDLDIERDHNLRLPDDATRKQTSRPTSRDYYSRRRGDEVQGFDYDQVDQIDVVGCRK